MDTPEIRTVAHPENQEANAVQESCVGALSESFAQRGLAKSVQISAEEQIKNEEVTRSMAPQAYRLSQMTQATLDGHYRRGKEYMSSEDVLRYFAENRREYAENADFDGNTGIDVCENTVEAEVSVVAADAEKEKKSRALVRGAKGAVLTAKDKLFRAAPTWMDFSRADASREKRRFPLSAFAAVLAVAMSLMLIVASSVMLTRAEGNLSLLKKEITATSAEVAKMRSDFEASVDLLEIRRIAVEEYGMVDQDYVKVEYIDLNPEDSVESFEEKERPSVGLSAILSALGLK
ncbi:MAG: hypothetical protein E7637_02980 [Ruminococcaceae bacterium]|nr:hypothetical protein [Oscillospiraceae bacterium]